MLASNDSGRPAAVLVVLMAALCLPPVGCKKAGSKATDPDAHGDGGDPLAELDRLEREMDRLGLRAVADEGTVAPAGAGEGAGHDGDAEYAAEAEAVEEQQPAPSEAAADHAPPKRSEVQHCSDVCDLSRAICDLEVRICSLSDSHDGDPSYGDACRRAGEDCDVADQACDRCGG